MRRQRFFFFPTYFCCSCSPINNGIYSSSSRHESKLQFAYTCLFSDLLFNNSLKDFYNLFQQFEPSIVSSLCFFTFILKTVYNDTSIPSAGILYSLNPNFPNASFLYPLKTSENRKVF